MKNIGILLSSPKEVGGIYQYSLSMISALSYFEIKKKFRITYFYTDKIWEKEIPNKSKKYYIKKNFYKKIVNKIFSFILPRSQRFLLFNNFLYDEVKFINKSECDLVIFPSQNITSYQINKKSLSTIHDLMHRYETQFEEYSSKIIIDRDFHYKFICKHCNGILVDSQLGKKHVIESYNVNKKKLHILPFVTPKYLVNKRKINISQRFKLPKKYIFYPAQFWEHKNHINLLKALKLILPIYKDLKILFCGSKKNYYSRVYEFVINNKLEKNVIFLGRVEDKIMSSLYKNALATVYPSFCGPTNIPPLEALMMKSPLICSNVYSMKKQLKNAAIYINPKNVLDIKKKIILVLSNKRLRNKLKINGKKIIIKYNQIHFNKKLENSIKKSLT